MKMDKAQPGERRNELSGLDTSNVAGIIVISALVMLGVLGKSFGGLSVGFKN